MLRRIAAQACQVAAVDQRQQPLGMQPPCCCDDCRIGGLVNLDSLLGRSKIEMDQRIEFIDQIAREGHGSSSLVETSGDDGAAF